MSKHIAFAIIELKIRKCSDQPISYKSNFWPFSYAICKFLRKFESTYGFDYGSSKGKTPISIFLRTHLYGTSLDLGIKVSNPFIILGRDPHQLIMNKNCLEGLPRKTRDSPDL